MKAPLCALALFAVLVILSLRPTLTQADALNEAVQVESTSDVPVKPGPAEPAPSSTPVAVTPTPIEKTTPTPEPSPIESPTPQAEPSATPTPIPTATPESSSVPEAQPASTPTPEPVATPKPRARRDERAWRGGVGFYWSGVNQLSFPGAQFNDLKYVARFSLDNAWGFQAEATYFREHSWGMQVGGMIDNQRSIRSVDKTGAVTGTTFYSGSTLDLRSGYLNALYRWGHFYMPFGVSYTGGIVGQPPVLLSSLSAGFGGQVGFGWAFNRYFVFEALYRLMTLKGLETDDGMNANQGNMGYLWGPQAGLKVLF